jgi:MFS family permease
VPMRVLFVLLAGQAMATMDQSILAVAAPSLRVDLHASDAQLQLVVAMYTLAFAVLVVIGARLGDVVGRRRAFLTGLVAFTLASLAGGLAPSPAFLIAARGAQGAAAALMTPQVLSIIQLQFAGERRARAIGAYSLILAVGVAAGQVIGGLLVGAELLDDAWRPALLLNAPVGVAVLLAARRGLPAVGGGPDRRLDVAGSAVLALALLALVLPLTFGRDAGWPAWVWPSLAACAPVLWGFVKLERRMRASGRDPLFDLDILRIRGVAAGVGAVLLVMACYAGVLLALTLHLQEALHFTPLRAGLTFAAYAGGFAVASLTWTRAGTAARERLPIAGPLLMGAALLGVGLAAAGGGWPVALTTPLLFIGGVGHACAYSPLASRLTTLVRADQASDLSGLILTATLVGTTSGAATFLGVYLSLAAGGSPHALLVTTAVLAAALLITTTCALCALEGNRWRPFARKRSSTRARRTYGTPCATGAPCTTDSCADSRSTAASTAPTGS